MPLTPLLRLPGKNPSRFSYGRPEGSRHPVPLDSQSCHPPCPQRRILLQDESWDPSGVLRVETLASSFLCVALGEASLCAGGAV